MKIALTTVSNNKRFLQNLSLIKSAWNRLGYEFKYYYIKSKDELIPKFEFDPVDIIDFGIDKDKFSLEFKVYAQSIRFRLASEFGKNLVLITDADIIPISKSHFSCNDGFDGVLHFNASEYYALGGMRYPACYYLMRSDLWARYCNPMNFSPTDWTEINARPLRYGIDELIVARMLCRLPIIKRLIHSDERVTDDNYGKLDKLGEIKDFHFHELSPNKVEEVYKSILERSNV